MKKIYLVLSLFWSLMAINLSAQQQISGTISDAEDGEPLIGANVVFEGTVIGTISDFNGQFVLQVPDGASKILISYTGYETETIDIGGRSTIDVQMTSGETLGEVLVIGYGTQKKSDKTGAVAMVEADELNVGRLSDPIQALQGKAAGVTVSKQGGDPNAGFSVTIRGAASYSTGSGPLYVIDGVPGVDPTTVSPDDIESFNILKDASSTAIYGSRGSNGVVIITTKGSSISKKETNGIEYSGILSFDQVANKLDFLDASQIRAFAEETGRTFIDEGGDVDWHDELYRIGSTQSNTLSFFGNDNNSSYRASLSHNDIQGVMNGTAKKRTIGRLNLTQKVLNNRVTLQARLSGTIEHNDYVNYGNGISPSNTIYQAMRRNPTDPVRNEDGTFYETDKSFQYYNPIAILEDYQNERDAKRLFGNIRANVNLLPGLSGSINLAYLRDDDESFYFEPSFAPSNQTSGFGRRSYNNNESKIIESTLNYVKTFNGVHNVNIIGGHSYQTDSYDGLSAQGKEAQSDYLQSYNLGALLNLESGSISSYKGESLLASFFGRAVYDFDKRYFVTATLRRDGSSKFGKNNEWGWFPSASIGWNVLRESFMSDDGIFSSLKLRAGYGVSGNQDIANNVDAVYYVPSGRAINPETGETVISFQNNNDINANPDLKWEENAELNIGVDFGILDDRLSGTLEVYKKNTKDLIYTYQLPVPPNKNRFIYANAGEIQNSGIELTLQGFIINKENLDWKSTLTFAKNSQKTIALSNDLYDLEEIKTLFVSGRGLVGGENWTQLVKVGEELGTFYLPSFAGFSDDGKFLFHTESGGVTRDVAAAERRKVGQAQPNFTLGWSNYFKMGEKFDLSMSWRAVVGFDVLNVTRMVFSNPADLPTLNVLEEALDEYAKGLTSSPIVSDYYLEDGSFLKLDNLSVGYNMPINSELVQSVRISVTGTNLLTITEYTGIDPELSYGGIAFGRDQYDVYPKTRSVTVGLNVKF